MSCLFCKIITGEIPANKVYEDDQLLGFKDINPEAPVHILIVPKKHIDSLNQVSADDVEILGAIQIAARAIAKEQGVDQSGYRLVSNCNGDAGQTVQHLHYHLLGGTKMGWPPFPNQ